MIAKILVCLFVVSGCENIDETTMGMDDITVPYVCSVTFKTEDSGFVYIDKFLCKGEYSYSEADFVEDSEITCPEINKDWDETSGMSCAADYLVHNTFFIETVEEKQNLIGQIHAAGSATIEKKFRLIDFMLE